MNVVKKYINAEEFKGRLVKACVHFQDRINNPAFQILQDMQNEECENVFDVLDHASHMIFDVVPKDGEAARLWGLFHFAACFEVEENNKNERQK